MAQPAQPWVAWSCCSSRTSSRGEAARSLVPSRISPASSAPTAPVTGTLPASAREGGPGLILRDGTWGRPGGGPPAAAPAGFGQSPAPASPSTPGARPSPSPWPVPDPQTPPAHPTPRRLSDPHPPPRGPDPRPPPGPTLPPAQEA